MKQLSWSDLSPEWQQIFLAQKEEIMQRMEDHEKELGLPQMSKDYTQWNFYFTSTHEHIALNFEPMLILL
jgi:hypothetical protein